MGAKNQQRQLDIYLDYYDLKYLTQNDKIIQGFCALGISLAVLGVSWALPFPHFGFLGKYNSYFNWASFVIAISIYYYSTLSPLLSYMMLFLALIFTYLISLIEKQFPNHYQMAGLFMLILLLSFLVHYQHNKKISDNNSVKVELGFIWLGPIWVLSLMLRRFRIKF
ncbi:MAG: hypothetical protein EOP43_05000 [Sphingobacteriaceae bacterium]|nr:MAG: hypothetical protein EOP43_05000 [Sphingobacteriaceae bacterium]